MSEESVASGVALEDELIIAHDLQLVNGIEVVLTSDIHRYHFDIGHIHVVGLSHTANQVLVVDLGAHEGG